MLQEAGGTLGVAIGRLIAYSVLLVTILAFIDYFFINILSILEDLWERFKTISDYRDYVVVVVVLVFSW